MLSSVSAHELHCHLYIIIIEMYIIYNIYIYGCIISVAETKVVDAVDIGHLSLPYSRERNHTMRTASDCKGPWPGYPQCGDKMEVSPRWLYGVCSIMKVYTYISLTNHIIMYTHMYMYM